MNYELKSSLHKKRVSTPIKIAIFLAVVIIIISIFIPHFLSSFFTAFVRPLWTIGNDREVSTDIENVMIKELQKENAELKALLGRSVDKNLVLGIILKKPPFSAYDIFVLDIGSINNVHVGDKVYAQGDMLIGEIIEVSRMTSKAKLYSSYGEKFEVLIGEHSLAASSTGRGGGSFEVFLPRDSIVREGDNVVVPNISSNAFGQVKKILTDPARPFSTILFSLPINPYELQWVQVEINKNE